jgi:hypothetical protein
MIFPGAPVVLPPQGRVSVAPKPPQLAFPCWKTYQLVWRSKDMQDGSVTVERRKRGPDVRSFRWRETGSDRRRIHRRIVLGSAEDLKSLASARKMVVGLRREINVNDVRIRKESITLIDLSRHYQQ